MIFWTKQDGKTYITSNNTILIHNTPKLILDYVSVKTAVFRHATIEIERADIETITLDGLCRIVIGQMYDVYKLDVRKAHRASTLEINSKQINIFV